MTSVWRLEIRHSVANPASCRVAVLGGFHEELTAAGREDQLRSVGGILQALKDRGRVDRVGRGQWVIADRA